MVDGIWKVYPRELDKGFGSKFHIDIYKPLHTGCMWHSHFSAESNRLEFRVFFLGDSLLYQRKITSLPYYLFINGERIIEFIPFLRVFVICKMQTTSPRIWTRVDVCIFYETNHFTMFHVSSCVQWETHEEGRWTHRLKRYKCNNKDGLIFYEGSYPPANNAVNVFKTLPTGLSVTFNIDNT